MGIKFRLIAMNFLQYAIWGSWLISLGAYLGGGLDFSGLQIGSFFATMGIASLFMPAVMGIIADRWIPAQKLLGICHFISGAFLIAAASQTAYAPLYSCMLLSVMFYMPTIALSNDDTTGTAKVTLGNNRNAGCRRISLGGDIKDTIDCSDSGATFDINENDLNTREITVTATVVPQRDASSGTGKSSFVPQYKVQPPTDVYTTGSGSTCTVHWTKQGHAQSYSVTADGIDSGTATRDGYWRFIPT